MFEVLRHIFNTPPFCAKKEEKDGKMLYIKMKKVISLTILCFVVSLILFATDSFAADKSLFSDLTATGSEIFIGMREIVYAVAGFGIVAVAVGGFFGNLNWKWLSAIIIGLVIIALTAGIINYMTDDSSGPTLANIHDTLTSGNDSGRK
ncbi:MAG: TrbC/VirB2 family protein [Lactobacillaceae bacterium]|jgi:type IV secretory pathway VirB2 component (pilin)|nr:TrbC/VirB2 family protein [Lactobacillaceae bacterium]